MSATIATTSSAEAAKITARLTDPDSVDLRADAAQQSLGSGKLGIALLHYERVRTGRAETATARTWLRASAYPRINSAVATNLFNGAPAVAFVLHTTAAEGPAEQLHARLHKQVKHITATRLTRARQRIRLQQPAWFGEYSQLSGLTGLGAYLLATEPEAELCGDVLSYLVDLTKPLRISGTLLPGWWAPHDPYLKISKDFPGGHANLGAAHGIAGPLACMAIASRAGISVPGQREAIEQICHYYDTWQHQHGWWPQWLTRPELEQNRSTQPGPGRPSWCYGTPGIARALQQAAIALDDPPRQRAAEEALLRCLDDETQQASLAEGGLCHGTAGLYRIVQRAVEDAHDPRLAAALPDLLGRLLESKPVGDGLLDGTAGKALVLGTTGTTIADGSTWDESLLIASLRGKR
ncbi:lanthionine synthetase C family protein [Glycomyces sp. L485]|uniref:lanthionine synthetase C family protein n=1 Tax=Glycomyces sp. L485 TaxID=2909235 RepID=UPI001F4B882A|nr:lanthionine synthetase C family protein [Glycomyces sp. L485]MCH7229968.1 lanthionine synthetase C family protein [Glycomyces sp. L485]